MGLHPLEYSDCLTDSPYFRENLHAHEKELERTSKAIKGLINDCKELLAAARNLSKAQRTFSQTLIDFKFETIGNKQTDDEIVIADSLKKFGQLITSVEDERDRMLERACDQIIHPLENFRKEHIGGAKEGKKKFDKQTQKFCQSLEKYLNLKAKGNDGALREYFGMKSKTTEGQLNEADAALEMERGHFYRASMQYVLLLQEVQERKKFEFVETLLGFMYGWLTFYHQGHDVYEDFKPCMTDLQQKLQMCRENFDMTHTEAEQLMNKMLEVRGTKPQDQMNHIRTCTREGYLYMMEKKALGTTWIKYYCQYQKENRNLTMIPYNQGQGKGITADTMVLTSCIRRASESIDKRFCFDITVKDRTGAITLQALSEDDRRLWLDAMDGKEPIYNAPDTKKKSNELDTLLDDIGFSFIKKCITAIEKRGLTDQGLYRVVGVNSKVNKLTGLGLDRRKLDKLNLDDPGEWEVKTITSALKNYFRSLPEPLMTFNLHQKFISAAKQESKTLRLNDIHHLVHKLPEANFEMLDTLFKHLNKVAENSKVNLMSVSNIGVCFGPTLMRPEEETIAAIMDIKFCNIVVEILIEYHHKVFKTPPDGADITETKVMNKNAKPTAPRPPKPAVIQSLHTSLSENNSISGSSPRQQPEPMQQPPPSASSTSSSGSSGSAGGGKGSFPDNRDHVVGQTYAQARAKLRPTGGIYGQFSPDHHSSTSSSSESLNSKCSSSNMSNNMTTSLPPSMTASTGQLETRRATTPVYGNLQQNTGGGQVGQYQTLRNSGFYRGKTRVPLRSSISCPGGSHRIQSPIYTNLPHTHTLPIGDLSNAEIGRLDQSAGLPRGINRHSQLPSTSSTSSSKTDPVIGSGYFRKRPSADSITFSISSSTSSVSSISSSNTGFGGRKVRTLYSCDAENESELSFEPNQIITNIRKSREPGWLEGNLEGKRGLIPANYVEYLN